MNFFFLISPQNKIQIAVLLLNEILPILHFFMPFSLYTLLSSPSKEWCVTKMLLSQREKVSASFVQMESQKTKRFFNASAMEWLQQEQLFLGIRKPKWETRKLNTETISCPFWSLCDSSLLRHGQLLFSAG